MHPIKFDLRMLSSSSIQGVMCPQKISLSPQMSVTSLSSFFEDTIIFIFSMLSAKFFVPVYCKRPVLTSRYFNSAVDS